MTDETDYPRETGDALRDLLPLYLTMPLDLFANQLRKVAR